MAHPLLNLRKVMHLKCPYCHIEYNSSETLNVHVQGCYYKDCPQAVQTDIEALTYQELRDMALSKGIRIGNMKKMEVIKALKEMEG